MSPLCSALGLSLLTACPGDGGGGEGGGTDSSSSGSSSASTTQTDTTVSTTATTTESDSNTTTASTTMTTTATSADSSGSGSETSTTNTTDTETDTDTGNLPPCPYTAVDGTTPTLVEVATGFDRPVLVAADPTQPDRLFVVEQGGDVRILEPGETTAPDAVFLHVDVPNANDQYIGDERGLLGFAFHPNFPEDPRVYVAYTPAGQGNSPPVTVVEYALDQADPTHVDDTTARVVIAVDKPAGNHNGGMIGFGPDGYLYLGMGDGGIGDDFFETGRDTGVLLSKLIRIDPEPDGTEDNPIACNNSCMDLGPFDYTIPDTNPFVDDNNFAPEIYAWGFRNPWRWHWDTNGDLYVGDVGQGDWEEIDVVVAAGDYGWSDMEGTHCFNDNGCDENTTPNAVNSDGITMPIIEYSHGSTPNGYRCSITGGAVYRSCEADALTGVYFYGDYCSGELFALSWDGSTVDDLGTVFDFEDENIIGSGRNGWGDVYITTVYVPVPNGPIQDGRIYRVSVSN
ncbi:MAG: PQQ-dependent sugar dehydrogenase [Nannocystaceae bacterium]